ncbi:MAG: amino acid-binding protein [Zetaproteobacteria bacterium]|nr:amino acid-binding protein [Zetaproteobacteria bacterium]
MPYVLLTVSGRDRAGIVCDVADALLHVDANIEDSSMTALRGRFTMMMVVHLPEQKELTLFKAVMTELEQRTALTVRSEMIEDADMVLLPEEPDCVITVSGADQAGIVFSVTELLVKHNISVVDVSTRARSSNHGDLYMMALEAVGLDDQEDALRGELRLLAQQLSVDIELHSLDKSIF